MLPGLPRDGAGARLRAVVGRARVDGAAEEGAAAVAGDSAVVDVVVGHVAAHRAGHLADELGALALGLTALGQAGRGGGGRRSRGGALSRVP